jgi:very-short-patch-repair endonuclease
MAQPDVSNGRRLGSEYSDAVRAGAPSLANAVSAQRLPEDVVAKFVLGAPQGLVLSLGGIDGESLRTLLDRTEPDPSGRRVLFTPIVPAPTTEAIVEQIIGLLAETARRLWPVWFTDVSFGGCRNDALGQLAAGVIARSAAKQIAGLSPAWADAAARLALDNRPPRVSGTPAAVEVAQLALTISRSGLVLLADVSTSERMGPNPAALVHALEWIATHAHCAVVALFSELPPNEPPFDRILYGTRWVVSESSSKPCTVEPGASVAAEGGPWIAPWRGQPHPLSDTEQRLAKALGADAELAPLFGFNQFVDTVRGSRPKVDLVWTAGRLVVELDGYGSHGNRAAFVYDRHRDYELTLSGYTVLRLANEEIAQDIERAIEKIRDLVRLRRTQITEEA